MTWPAIASIIAALLTGALATAILSWVQDRRRAPIERRQADEASVRVASEIRTADIEGLRDIIQSLREEVTELRRRVDSAEERAASAELRAVSAERRAVEAEAREAAALSYIEQLIGAWVGPEPPPPPPRSTYISTKSP